MNIFDQFNWMSFFQQFVMGIGMGTIASVSISLNIRTQNKYHSAPTSFLNIMQSIIYVASVILSFSAIFYLVIYATDNLNNSPINSVFFIFGIIAPIVLAFRSGFIPKDLTRGSK